MPGLDRTGPEGEGPRTGRQMGRCAPPGNQKERMKDQDQGKDSPARDTEDFEERGLGRITGRGLGRGTGRGTGRGMGRGVGRNRRRKRGN